MFIDNLTDIAQEFNKNPYCVVNINIDEILQQLQSQSFNISVIINITSKDDENDKQEITFNLLNYTLRHDYTLQASQIIAEYEDDIDFIIKNGESKPIGVKNSLPLIKSSLNDKVFTLNNIPQDDTTTILYIIQNFKSIWRTALYISRALLDYKLEEKKKSLMQ